MARRKTTRRGKGMKRRKQKVTKRVVYKAKGMMKRRTKKRTYRARGIIDTVKGWFTKKPKNTGYDTSAAEARIRQAIDDNAIANDRKNVQAFQKLHDIGRMKQIQDYFDGKTNIKPEIQEIPDMYRGKFPDNSTHYHYRPH